ncbi:MAG: HD-GYP domain-containing protein [Xanthomonadaceae bacterium]|nr:HD-GYP domain-containing protein [Xanthomonadaceae bacterium]MDE3071760.1 HD-GYP domain-containing protein [Pseudomonadota bacterium]
MNVIKQLSRWLTPREGGNMATHAGDLLASLLTMAWFVEARDPYTGGHLWRVSRYAQLLAERAGFGPADVARISLGGFLHDLGKVGVPDAILRKPGRLTEEEYAVIRTHPEIGSRMLSGHPLAYLVQDAVLLHHERPDGRGYPHRLAGSAIPEMARIVGICDAFDAMTSYRPYRSALPRDEAIAIIHEHRGSQFDAQFADGFVALGRTGRLDHVMGHSDDGIPLLACRICGPTLVVHREHAAGHRLYCRNCAGEYELAVQDNCLIANPTGKKGGAVDLEPGTDNELIARTVNAAVEALPVAKLLALPGVPHGRA